MADTILEVKNLTKYFKTKHGTLHAVDGINFKPVSYTHLTLPTT